MIPVEYKIIEHDKYVEGYFLTINDLRKLITDFQNNSDGNIEVWLKTHERIEK